MSDQNATLPDLQEGVLRCKWLACLEGGAIMCRCLPNVKWLGIMVPLTPPGI